VWNCLRSPTRYVALRSGREQGNVCGVRHANGGDAARKMGIRIVRGTELSYSQHAASGLEGSGERSGALIVGREDSLHLESICAICAEKISLKPADGKEIKLTWKVNGTNEIEVRVPLKDTPAGKVQLLVQRFGQAHADE